MTNRAGVTALVTLAMLNVFTLGAGVAVANMLPARLALWQVPRLARSRPETPGLVLAPASARAAAPDRARLAALLAPMLAARPLGQHVGAVVTDLDTGTVLFSQKAGSAFVPASNAKLLTAVAALSALGPSARFTTRVVAGARPGLLTLVGGGDPTLAAGPPPRSDYPQPATLASLAASTAHWLAAPRGADRAAELRHLAVHRAGHRAGLDPQLRQHGQRHGDHLAGGGPGAADTLGHAAGRRRPQQLPAPVRRTRAGGGGCLRAAAPPRRHQRDGPGRCRAPAAAAQPRSRRYARPRWRRSSAGCSGRATT